jgi:hypothetical protein
MKRMLGAVAVAALFTAVPAIAAPVTINFTGNSLILGTDGNARSYSDAANTVNVRATAWSWDGSTVRDSFLGAYGSGLGVTSGDELGLLNTHVVDNQNRVDFVLLQFDQTVSLTSAVFNSFKVGLNRVADSDATIAWGTLAGVWNQGLTFDNTDGKSLAKLFAGSADALDALPSASRALDLGTAAGNFWLIGANFENADRKIDGFKLGGVTLKTVAPVPEPSTWALMLAGFALVGVAMRRAIRTSEQRFTDKVRRIATTG